MPSLPSVLQPAASFLNTVCRTRCWQALHCLQCCKGLYPADHRPRYALLRAVNLYRRRTPRLDKDGRRVVLGQFMRRRRQERTGVRDYHGTRERRQSLRKRGSGLQKRGILFVMVRYTTYQVGVPRCLSYCCIDLQRMGLFSCFFFCRATPPHAVLHPTVGVSLCFQPHQSTRHAAGGEGERHAVAFSRCAG